MNRKNLLHLIICLLLLPAQLWAQQDGLTSLEGYFTKAYQQYPNVPKGLLEAMAYSASHINNLNPHADSDHTNCLGMPERHGLFGLIENGKGYFKNNLLEVCKLSNITPAQFKKDVGLQILAVARFLSQEASTQKLAAAAPAESFAGVLEKLTEIPNNGNKVNTYARSLYTYDIYYHLQKGFTSPSLNRAPVNVQLENIYPQNTLRKLQGRGIKIDYNSGTILPQDTPANSHGTVQTNGTNTANGETTTNGTDGDVTVLSTDYGPALWDQAHTNNWSVGRGGTAITNVTVHTMQGSYAGTISWFNNGSAVVSAHYCVRSSDGQITQMVRDADRAYHVLSANYYTIGIEHEGFVTDASWYTENMYQSSAALVRDICSSWTIDKSACFPGPATSGTNFQPITVRIKGHQHYSGNTHTDPGINWNWPKYKNLINPPTAVTRIAFLIKDQSAGTAIASATISAAKVGGSTTTLTTNASGQVVFNADTGRYNFTISKSGYSALTTYFIGRAADDSIAADINLDLTGAVTPTPGVPSTVRVATSCACTTPCNTVQVQVMSLEAYVQTGLDDEWLSSWNAASLQAGAVAYRSRGAWYAQHPFASNYDLSAATCHQTWQNDRAVSVKNAAIATAGVVLVKNGAIIKADYAAENNNAGCGDGSSGNGSTWPCIADIRCAGKANNGSGKGMCQWGSSFWGTDQTYTWILNHYYGPDTVTIQTPGSILMTSRTAVTTNAPTREADHLQLSPNPVTGTEVKVSYLLEEASQAATIALLDHYGRMVRQQRVQLQPGNNQLSLSVGKLKAGLYTVTIRLQTGKTESKKLLATD